MIMWGDWLCISRNAIMLHDDLLCLVNMLVVICCHDIDDHHVKSLIYCNMLPCCCFALLHGCCELASTFNVLTWRVMPDLQAVLGCVGRCSRCLRARRRCSQCPCGLEFVIAVIVPLPLLFRC